VSTDADGLAELLTIEEVAERLRVSVLTVRWLRQEGRFAPAIKVGRRQRGGVGSQPDQWPRSA
jgi:excisionase family DNA binding protein